MFQIAYVLCIPEEGGEDEVEEGVSGQDIGIEEGAMVIPASFRGVGEECCMMRW